MRRRRFVALILVWAGAWPAAALAQDAAQTSDADARRQGILETVKILSAPASAARELPPPKGWRPAKTPWGHPDIGGIFTNNDERMIPLERPAEFAGRRQADITPEELSKISESRRAAQIERLVSEAPRDPGTIGWFEAWNARNSRAWLIVEPEDGRVPPLTPEGQRRAAARRQSVSQLQPIDRQFDRNFETRCLSLGVPGSMMPAFYGSAYEIHQSPDFVAIRFELNHETRLIPLDGRRHVGRGIRSYMGDPRGWWEGDTLVVETTNFNDEIAYRESNGATLRLTERFTPLGPNLMQWSVTVDDPMTWVRPWTFAMNLTRRDRTQQPYEFACHEGNYSMRHILEALREPR